MIKKTIAAMIAFTAALTFCGCKSRDDEGSKADESNAAVSSAESVDSVSSEDSSDDISDNPTESDTSAENADMDVSDDVSDTESTSEEKPSAVTSISEKDQPVIQTETGIVIVTEDGSTDVTSASADSSDVPYEINIDGDEYELPIVPADP